jgi:hypothetical protein
VKPRHAAALALVGWCLSFVNGKTVPKDWPSDYAHDLGESVERAIECGFKTQAECEAASRKVIPNFDTYAKENGQRVVLPPSSLSCSEQK